NFAESLQKALRSLEQGRLGFAVGDDSEFADLDDEALWRACATATPTRLFAVHEALRRGGGVDEVAAATRIDPWFVHQMHEIVARERELSAVSLASLDRRGWLRYKQWGFSDAQLSAITGVAPAEVTRLRRAAGAHTVFKTVDTCAAEFEAATPYHYSTYDDD
ncbi:carbamoyl phosphate synthase large subunit, partial [mine drainage metagenome]